LPLTRAIVEDIHQLVGATVENNDIHAEKAALKIFAFNILAITTKSKVGNNFKYPFRNCLSARPYILFNLIDPPAAQAWTG